MSEDDSSQVTDGNERTKLEFNSKDELYQEIVEHADLPEKDTTASYPFRHSHLVELVRYLRTVDTDTSHTEDA